jgi:hypothetical protein
MKGGEDSRAAPSNDSPAHPTIPFRSGGNDSTDIWIQEFVSVLTARLAVQDEELAVQSEVGYVTTDLLYCLVLFR